MSGARFDRYVERQRGFAETELQGIEPKLVKGGHVVKQQNPTLSELEAIIAKVEHGTNWAAAEALGISEQTMKNHISSVIRKLGAVHATHAIYLMWPILEHIWYRDPVKYRWLPGSPDRRLGVQRRRRPATSPRRQNYRLIDLHFFTVEELESGNIDVEGNRHLVQINRCPPARRRP